MLRADAPSICPEHSALAMLGVDATRICTDVRTYERTDEDGWSPSRDISLTDTCARVQDFDDLENDR